VGHRIENPGPEASDTGVLVEIKRAHEQATLHNLVDQSRVLSRLGEMASGVAHELRDPLQTLTLELDAIAVAARDGDAVEPSVRQAREKIARLDRAIRGFLKIARLRPPSVGPVDANALLREIGEASRTNADLAGLEISLDLEGLMPRVAGDEEVLRQAVGNLLGNALQAYPSRDGGIVLRSRRAGETIRLTVSDAGPGIPPEELDRVFELFYSTREGGTGVGLALVRQSVEMLGGRVSIVSAPGTGTEVTLELPMAVSA
jgi:signal transduction histidine kinase